MFCEDKDSEKRPAKNRTALMVSDDLNHNPG
jgi:hypothetical protein